MDAVTATLFGGAIGVIIVVFLNRISKSKNSDVAIDVKQEIEESDVYQRIWENAEFESIKARVKRFETEMDELSEHYKKSLTEHYNMLKTGDDDCSANLDAKISDAIFKDLERAHTHQRKKYVMDIKDIPKGVRKTIGDFSYTDLTEANEHKRKEYATELRSQWDNFQEYCTNDVTMTQFTGWSQENIEMLYEVMKILGDYHINKEVDRASELLTALRTRCDFIELPIGVDPKYFYNNINSTLELVNKYTEQLNTLVETYGIKHPVLPEFTPKATDDNGKTYKVAYVPPEVDAQWRNGDSITDHII